MSYLPVYCVACARASLSATRAHGEEQELMCSFCEGPVRVVPGPVYGDGDWLAFAEIDAAVHQADLDGGRAHVLSRELQALMDGTESQTAIVREMITKVPELDRARPALLNRLPRGLRMLSTLLVARFQDLPMKSGAHNAEPLLGSSPGQRKPAAG